MDFVGLFNTISPADIAEFIRQEQEENLHLEFKTLANANMRAADDKRNLARALSGFANSSGGLIVWGVAARKNAQGVDCASASVEISAVRELISRLNELTGEAVSPMVDGVLHKPLETFLGRGYAVTLVPESVAGPHMAKLGEDRYYKRSGDSFYRMEHFDLEDMFGRRQKPNLRVRLRHDPSLQRADEELEELHFSLLNDGRAIAKHAGFFAKFQNAELRNVIDLQNVSHLNPGTSSVCYYNATDVVHPNGISTHAGHVIFRRIDADQDVVLDLTYYCEDMRFRSDTVRLSSPARAKEGV
jgi:Schlafen, AlbA_2